MVRAALALAVLAAAVGGGLAWRRSPGRSGPGPDTQLPGELAGARLLYAEPDQTLIVRGDGRIVRSFPDVEAAGFPGRPMITADRVAVFVHAHRAYRVEPGGTVAQPVEPASVEYLAADGAIRRPGATPRQLPPDTFAVARLTTGLLLLSGDGHLLSADHTGSRPLGPIDSVIGTVAASVAWTARDGCSADQALTGCPLHITETSSGADRVIGPPPGFGGFVGGGGFSPDGSWLAAFVITPTGTGPGVRPVLVATGTGRVQVVGPVLPAGEPIGSAGWSPDGRWLFFCGLSGPMYALRAGGDVIGSPVALPLPASYAFVAL